MNPSDKEHGPGRWRVAAMITETRSNDSVIAPDGPYPDATLRAG